MKPSKAGCLDYLSMDLVKIAENVVIDSIQHLFNCSIKSGKFPSRMKHGMIIPLWKGKGDKATAKSYRPVTLLNPIGKIIEKTCHGPDRHIHGIL